LSMLKSPVKLVLVNWNTRGVAPVFVTVTPCELLAKLMIVAPNTSDDGVTVSPAPVPVPDRVITCGLLGSLSVTVS